MSSAGEPQNLTAAGKLPAKEKKPKVPKAKKAKTAKTASHPPYFQMIKEALLALNERGGSSPHAIAKYMEQKHTKVLPENFRKMLALQLKNSAAKGKLVKVKASYKLSEDGKKVKAPAAAGKKGKAAGKKPKQTTKKPASSAARATATATVTATVTASGRKVKATPKKATVKKAKKMTPMKAKQAKSIKSPGAKRARKAVA